MSNIKDILTLTSIFGFCGLALACFSGCQSQRLYKDTRALLGTFVEVISPYREAPGIVFLEMQRVDNLLSKYNPISEVAKLNREGILKASPETYYVIKQSVAFYQMTQGAFDITIGPLLDLWGFTDNKYNVPSKTKIRETLKIVGSDKIILDANDLEIKFKFPGMKIDLGGIAKGFALDCAVRKLREANINSCLINAGGQVYALGDRFNKPWRIALQNPKKEGGFSILELKNQSAATSSNNKSYFVLDGKRYGHLINPNTGYPVESNLASITVVATQGLIADALSTSIFILGQEDKETLLKNFKDVRIEAIYK